MLKTSLEDAFYSWVRNYIAEPVPVVLSRENAPKNSTPFVLFEVRSQKRIGGLDSVVNKQREAFFVVDSFGADAFDYLNKLTDALNTETGIDLLNSAGLSSIDFNEIVNASELQGINFEEHWQVEFRFRVGETIDDTAGEIRTVSLENTGNGNIITASKD